MFPLIFIFCLLLTNTASATDQPFTIGIRLLKPITTTLVQPLNFPDAEAGVGQNLVVKTTSDNAATFAITANKNSFINSTILESSVTLSSTSTPSTITIDGFRVTAPSATNDQGKAIIKVGGTAHVDAKDLNGDYSGSATLRVVYL
jgi:hypothetical protein